MTTYIISMEWKGDEIPLFILQGTRQHVLARLDELIGKYAEPGDAFLVRHLETRAIAFPKLIKLGNSVLDIDICPDCERPVIGNNGEPVPCSCINEDPPY